MAWRSRLAAAAAIALAPGVAAADRGGACEGDFAFTLFTARYAVLPEPRIDDGVGLDLWLRGPSVTWGEGCHGSRHRFDFVESEAPDYGDADHGILHAAAYSYAWHAGEVTVHAGAHTVTRWGTNLRFVTPFAGVDAEASGDVLVRAQLESAGVFALALDRTPRRPLDDVALDASLVWPASEATRAEVRTRVRRYLLDDRRLRDVTVTAGFGLALGARERQRALPGFIGVAVRAGDATQLLVVAELGFGLASR